MGQPANVTSLPEPLCQRYILRANKEASILQRRTLIFEAENERFGHFSPLDSVSADSREAAVRSGSGSNPRRRTTDQPGPSDLLHHDTGDGETFIYLNFVLNSQLLRSGTPSTLRRRRRSATRSRYSSSDNPARQSTRTLVKPSTNRCAANSIGRSPNLTQRQSAAASKRQTASLVGNLTVTVERSGWRCLAPASRTPMTIVAMFRSRNWSRFPTPIAKMCPSSSASKFQSSNASRSPTQRPSRFARMCTGRSLRG